MQTKTSVSIKIATPFLAVFIIIALYGSFLFDTDGTAVGLTLLGLSEDSITAIIFGLLGDLVWILGIITAILAGVSITLLVSDSLAKQAALLRYLTTRDKKSSVGDLYPNKVWKNPLLYLNCVMALIGMGSGFWFTGTAWLVSLVGTHMQHTKMRNLTLGIEGVALDQGLDGVRKLATKKTLALVDAAQGKED